MIGWCVSFDVVGTRRLVDQLVLTLLRYVDWLVHPSVLTLLGFVDWFSVGFDAVEIG